MTPEHSHPDNKGHKPVILAVDDDPNNLAVIRDSLVECDYTLLVAEDGESAIIRAEYARPDIILLDIMMPGVDGIETCRRLKALEATKRIPVIFMTALAETAHKVRGFEVGAVDYITKPFQREELLARIAVHLQIRALTSQLLEANATLEQRVEERTIDLALANRELEEEIAERQATQEKLQEQAQLLEEKVEELQQTQKELRQSHKMEAVGTLAAGIAHDFNNILMAITGFTEMSLMKMDDSSPLKQNLNQVHKASQRAAELVNQILTFTRQSEQEMKVVSMAGITRDVLMLLRSTLPTTIEIRQEMPEADALSNVMADSTQLHQVLMNLGTNACHAMRANGGVLHVVIDQVRLDAPLGKQLRSLHPGMYVRLTVSDTGHGMSSKVMERIFDPYYTTKQVGEGTGLGLSVVLGIVKNHGGTITVESQSGKGTTFQAYFPLIQPDVAIRQQHDDLIMTGTERILFVDDEEALVTLGKNMLEDLGYMVTTATDSREALTMFRNDPKAFDLVITDLTLPYMTGVELAREIAAIRPTARVLFSTGYNDVRQCGEWLNALSHAYIKKPYLMSLLARSVRNALDADMPAAV